MLNRSRADVGSSMQPNTKELQPELTDEPWSLFADLVSHRPPDF